MAEVKIYSHVNLQGSSLLTVVKDLPLTSDALLSPLTAFVMAETALAVQLVQIIHNDLLIINRSLKSNSPLPVHLMQSAADIAILKVKCPLLRKCINFMILSFNKVILLFKFRLRILGYSYGKVHWKY